jgi:cell division protein FtsW (lipid II flippase)
MLPLLFDLHRWRRRQRRLLLLLLLLLMMVTVLLQPSWGRWWKACRRLSLD